MNDPTPDWNHTHRWSGWPGAYCLHCHAEDAHELGLACIDCIVRGPERTEDGGYVYFCPEHRSEKCPAWKGGDPYEEGL